MKSKQRGAISITGIVVLVVIVLLGLWAVGINNTVVRQEAGIVGANKSRQAVLSNLSQKVQEAIGVQDMNVENIRKTVNEQIKLRSGAEGMKATVLFLRENNIPASQELAMKIVNLIDQGRDKFTHEEKMMTDRKVGACMYRGQFPNNVVIGITGAAKLEIGCNDGPDKYAPLMNERTSTSFETGKDQGLYDMKKPAAPAAQ
jgi:hypothetical protein